MKKICFVLVLNNVLSYTPLSPGLLSKKDTSLKDYFSQFYDVDYLVLPEPFAPFDNENNLPIIKVPSKFFLTKDFEKIKEYIDDYFKENDDK